MQESLVHAAQGCEPRWYLARGDKQYGPLRDREMALFAKGGNLRSDDLLWKLGFKSWEPAQAVYQLAQKAQAGGEILHPSEAALAGCGETAKDKPTLKQRVVQEIKQFAAIFLYLWVVFLVLLIHEWIVLSQHAISFKFYELGAINALVLAKIMLIADHFPFAERLQARPLMYPIAYKAVAFTTLLFVAYVLEEMLLGWFRGKGFFDSVPQVGGGTVLGALSLWLIFCVALLPFSAFKEIQRAIGAAEFRWMLFGRRADSKTASPPPSSA
ncbi:MAG: DUF4339 domain-containing protein [Methyloceanibacter sp.]